jgi:transcriptional regulator with XRE-family HTH domain
METNKNIQNILNQSSYWVEAINGSLFHAIIQYMETNNLKRKDLAALLEISPGRVSQILNSGDINFSLEKIIEIALKINKFPAFEFIDKKEFTSTCSSSDNPINEENVGEYLNAFFYDHKEKGYIKLIKTGEPVYSEDKSFFSLHNKLAI